MAFLVTSIVNGKKEYKVSEKETALEATKEVTSGYLIANMLLKDGDKDKWINCETVEVNEICSYNHLIHISEEMEKISQLSQVIDDKDQKIRELEKC